jgi:hypothetical protein
MAQSDNAQGNEDFFLKIELADQGRSCRRQAQGRNSIDRMGVGHGIEKRHVLRWASREGDCA